MTRRFDILTLQNRGRGVVPKRMNFRKVPKGGRIIFNPKIILQMLDLYTGLFQTFSEKKAK